MCYVAVKGGGGLDGGFAPTPPVRTAVIGDLYRAVPIFFMMDSDLLLNFLDPVRGKMLRTRIQEMKRIRIHMLGMKAC